MMKLLFAAVGSLGFGILFNANKNKLVLIAIGGFVNYLAYLISFYFTSSLFVSSLICAFVTLIYSELMAYISKAPATIFILTGLIPSVPGASIFYMMQNLVIGDKTLALSSCVEACEIILGIVSGVALASVLIGLIKSFIKK